MLTRFAVLLSLTCAVSAAFAQQRGVPQNGFPTWQERMLHVLFNRARAEPTADPKACTATTVRNPLAWQYNFGRAARFHSANLSRTGCFQHNSPCLLFTDISSRYPPLGTCDGSASCACQNTPACNSACTATQCTQTFTRISYFGSSGNGEIIAGGYGSPRAAHTGWMNSAGHCGIILGGGGSVGTGWFSNTWTGNFGSGSAMGTLIAGGHEVGTSGQFLTSTAQNVGLRVNYFNAGGAPQSAQVNVSGTCHGMTLERGDGVNGTYLATVPLGGTTCLRYVFTFRDPAGNTVLLPETGSYGLGGSLATCADWDAASPSACGVSDPPPTVATPASATPNPVTGTTTALSVLGADNAGEAALSYTWSATGPAAVTFSANGTNGAKNTTATFTRAGTYTFTVSIRDVNGQSVGSIVTVTVAQTLTSVVVTPATATVVFGASQTFAASGRDQFNQVMSPQPTFTWAVSGGGTVSTTGVFTAGSTAGGPYDLTATTGALAGTARVTVSLSNPPSVATAASASPNPTSSTTSVLSVLGADDGGEANLTYTWARTSGPGTVTFSTNGTNSAKSSTATFTAAGSYTFTVTITDSSGQSVTSTVTVTVTQSATRVGINPAAAVVAPSGTLQFTAQVEDQFGGAMASQPNNFNWSVSGGGTMGNRGLFTAGGATGGPFTVTASAQGRSGTAQVTVAAGTPPTVASPADATPNPVTLTTTQLSVLGADDGGEAALTYTWASTGPAAVTFSGNGTNAAKAMLATFSRAGTYTFTVTIRDAGGLAVSSTVEVVVSPVLTTLAVSPASVTLAPLGTQPFTVSALDQFGDALAVPPTVTWSVSGGGAVDAAGLFTAVATPGGPHTLTATAESTTGTASITIATGGSAPSITAVAAVTPSPVTGTSAQATVTADDDGGEASLTYSWSANGPATVAWSANNSNAAKASTATFSRAGNYTLTVTVRDAGGLTATSQVNVTVEQTPAQVAVSPPSINVVTGGTQAFTVGVTDQFARAIAPAPATTWTVSGGGSIDAAGLFTAGSTPSGPHVVTAQVGATSATASVTVVAPGSDTTPPTVALLSPAAGATLSGVETVVAQASDDVGVQRVEFLVDGVVQGTVTAAPWEWAFNTALVANGPHSLAARAADAAGNSAQTVPIDVTVQNSGMVADVTPPTVLVLTPTDGQAVSGSFDVNAEATDESGVASVHFHLDGVEVASATAPPYLTRLSAAELSQGDHTVFVTARDPAGNVGRSADVRVVVGGPGAVIGACGCTSAAGSFPLLALAALLRLAARGRRRA